MTPQQYLDLAERFVGAIQSGDTETVRACYHPDAKLWHNTDNIEQTVDQNMKVLGWFCAAKPCPMVSYSSTCSRPPCPTAVSSRCRPALWCGLKMASSPASTNI
jgi:hypothetical protein